MIAVAGLLITIAVAGLLITIAVAGLLITIAVAGLQTEPLSDGYDCCGRSPDRATLGMVPNLQTEPLSEMNHD